MKSRIRGHTEISNNDGDPESDMSDEDIEREYGDVSNIDDIFNTDYKTTSGYQEDYFVKESWKRPIIKQKQSEA